MKGSLVQRAAFFDRRFENRTNVCRNFFCIEDRTPKIMMNHVWLIARVQINFSSSVIRLNGGCHLPRWGRLFVPLNSLI